MSTQVNITEAKRRFSGLVERAAAGEEIVIARAGNPVAKLIPVNEGKLPERRLGAWKGKLWLAEDWDSDAVNEEIARTFEGE